MRGTPVGAKERDYWWTVLAVDPVALPLVRFLARTRWLTPDETTWLSFFLGVAVGPAYALGGRAGLVAGALLFYLSFVVDCVDGKLARALDMTSDKGKLLDEVADGARRVSASLGLVAYLFETDASGGGLWWAVIFAVLSFFFMQISGGTRSELRSELGGRWSRLLARRRLLPNPGMPDVSAIAFVIGPVLGMVVPGLAVGAALVSIGILRVLWGLAR